jgi:hypothetical protein
MAKATTATTKKKEALKDKEKAVTIKNEAASILDKDPSEGKEETNAENLLAEEEKPKTAKELLKEINWFDLKSIKKQKSKEEPLHIMVYYRIMHYPQASKTTRTPRRNLKSKSQELQRHGKITFSKFLSQKFGMDSRIKFGALDGKIILQATKNDGIAPKSASKETNKLCVSCADVVEIIYNKYGLKEGANSVYFTLKDLGNNFYLIDEIMK